MPASVLMAFFDHPAAKMQSRGFSKAWCCFQDLGDKAKDAYKEAKGAVKDAAGSVKGAAKDAKDTVQGGAKDA